MEAKFLKQLAPYGVLLALAGAAVFVFNSVADEGPPGPESERQEASAASAGEQSPADLAMLSRALGACHDQPAVLNTREDARVAYSMAERSRSICEGSEEDFKEVGARLSDPKRVALVGACEKAIDERGRGFYMLAAAADDNFRPSKFEAGRYFIEVSERGLAECATQLNLLSETARAAELEHVPEVIRGEISKYERLQEDCRGGLGDSPATSAACEEWPKHTAKLAAQGWCLWVDPNAASASEAKSRWQPCTIARTPVVPTP